MMMMFFARVIVGLWLMISGMLLIATFADVLFATRQPPMRKLAWRVASILIWPLFIPTASGRARFVKAWKGIN